MSWVKDLLKLNECAGIECQISPDGNYILLITRLKRNKDKVDVIFSKEIDSGIKSLNEVLDNKIPIALNISGKGIIHKKIESSTYEEEEGNELHKVIPGAKPSDFYVQVFHDIFKVTDGKYVSIIRKDLLNKIIKDFISIGYLIKDCTLGPFCLVDLKSIILSKNRDSIKIGSTKLDFENEKLVNLTFDSPDTEEQLFQIGDYNINNKFLPSFCSGFYCFLDTESPIEFNVPEVIESSKEIVQKQRFSLFGVSVLIFFFIILLINFLLFQFYREKNNELSYKLVSMQKSLEINKNLESEYETKRNFLLKNNLMESSRISFYADRLAKSLPENINLTGLDFFPLNMDKNSEVTSFNFKAKLIIISGESKNSALLNDWMKEIKTFAWINQVNLLNYIQENIVEKGKFNVEIKLN